MPECTGLQSVYNNCELESIIDCTSWYVNWTGDYYQCSVNITGDPHCDDTGGLQCSYVEETTTSSSEVTTTEVTTTEETTTSSSEVTTTSTTEPITSTTTPQQIWSTLNTTLDSVVGLIPKIGDLLNGVGTNLIWPVVYILVILGIAGVILGVFGMVVGIVAAVLLSVTKFAHNIGNKRK
jgi:hypothetical protein